MTIPFGRGGAQEAVCLPLDLVLGWLFTVDASRIGDDAVRASFIGAVIDDDVGASRAKRLCDSGPDAFGGSGDESSLACELAHSRSPLEYVTLRRLSIDGRSKRKIQLVSLGGTVRRAALGRRSRYDAGKQPGSAVVAHAMNQSGFTEGSSCSARSSRGDMASRAESSTHRRSSLRVICWKIAKRRVGDGLRESLELFPVRRRRFGGVRGLAGIRIDR